MATPSPITFPSETPDLGTLPSADVSDANTIGPNISATMAAVSKIFTSIPPPTSDIKSQMESIASGIMPRQLGKIFNVVEALAPSHTSRRSEGSNLEERQLDAVNKIVKALIGSLPARRVV